MKKIYMSPCALEINIETTSMLAASVEGFEKTLDNDNKIGVGDMLGRENDFDED